MTLGDRQLHTAKRIALIVVCLGSAQSAMTLSSIQIAIPDIARELRPSATMLSWIPMAFLLVNAIFILPMGRYADSVGRKKVYLAGMILFGVGNLLAGFADSIEWVVFCRAVQGISTAMLHATGMAIIASIYQDKERPAALALAASSIYLGLSFGPVAGGFLTEYFGWRSVFVAQVPVSLICVLLVLRYLKSEWKSEEPMPVDWPGVAILGVALTSAVFSIAESAKLSSQLHTVLVPTGLMLVACLAAWIFMQHLKRSPTPLIRWHSIRGNSVFVSSLSSAFFVYAGNYTMVFLMSLFLQFLFALTPSQAGLIILLQTLTIAAVSLFVGKLGSKTSDRALVCFGCGMVSVGFAILAFVDNSSALSIIVFAMILNGIGMGLFTTPNNNAALGAVNPQRLSAATAILNLARYLGNMLGTAIVMLLMVVFIGNADISPSNYPQLGSVVTLSFVFAMLATATASVLAYRAYR